MPPGATGSHPAPRYPRAGHFAGRGRRFRCLLGGGCRCRSGWASGRCRVSRRGRRCRPSQGCRRWCLSQGCRRWACPRGAGAGACPGGAVAARPERVAVAGAGRAGVPQGFGRGHRLIGGPGVLEQGPRDRGRDDPAIPRLRVDHPKLQVATRPHRGEQRGQVIGEVIQRGRPPGFPAAAFPVAAAGIGPVATATGPVADPVAEGQAGRRGPGRRPGQAHQHQLGVQRVSDVAVTRVTRVSSVAVAGWRPGAPGVEVPPDFLAGGPPAGRLALAERGVRERGHQHGPDVVGEAPAPAVAAGGRGIAAGVQAHLD